MAYDQPDLSGFMYGSVANVAAQYEAAYAPLYQGVASGGYDTVIGFMDDLDALDDEDDDRWDEIEVQARSLHSHYTAEKEDSQHRMGDLLAAGLSIYNKAKSGQIPDKYGARLKSFYPWLDGIPEFERVVLIKSHPLLRNGADQLRPSMVKAFITGVKYLDAATRKNYVVHVAGGMCMQGGTPFSTDDMSTVHSGRGFAIFVIDMNDNLYAASHKLGMFHHSSFTAGEQVRGAGELIIKAGRIKYVSAKSGHYKPTMDHLLYTIRLFRDKGVSLDSFHVLAWDKFGYNAPLQLVKASEFVDQHDQYEIWGQGKPTLSQLRAIGA